MQSYEVSTADLGENDTLSAIDTSELGTLEAALQTFVTDALKASPAEWALLRAALAGVPQYENPDYADLGDYMANVTYALAASDPTLAADAAVVLADVGTAVVARTNDFRNSQGLAIELPGVENAADYVQATYQTEAPVFDGKTNWSEFVQVFDHGAGASAISTAVDWAGNNAEAAFAFNLHDVLGDGLVYDGLQIGPVSTSVARRAERGTPVASGNEQWFRFHDRWPRDVEFLRHPHEQSGCSAL